MRRRGRRRGSEGGSNPRHLRCFGNHALMVQRTKHDPDGGRLINPKRRDKSRPRAYEDMTGHIKTPNRQPNTCSKSFHRST